MDNLEDADKFLDHSLTSIREYVHEYPKDVRAGELKLKMIELQERLRTLIKDRR